MLMALKESRGAFSANQGANREIENQGVVKKRRKRRTRSEMEALRAERKKATHEKFKASAEHSIKSIRSAGLSHYIWRGVCDERACSDCRDLEGKRFSIDKPPPIGHPGAHKCDIEGYCRCYAEPDFTGTPFDIKE